jgi:hypothetical protein
MSCFDRFDEADPRDRPQKIKCKLLMSSVVHSHSNYSKARFDSRPYSCCKVSKSGERHKAAISTIDQNSFYYLLCPSAVLI